MYTIKLLAPILISACAEEFITSNGDYCVVNRSQPNVIKYYEPGKSCYIEGIFYESCPKRK
jgi:hypothetical protein